MFTPTQGQTLARCVPAAFKGCRRGQGSRRACLGWPPIRRCVVGLSAVLLGALALLCLPAHAGDGLAPMLAPEGSNTPRPQTTAAKTLYAQPALTRVGPLDTPPRLGMLAPSPVAPVGSDMLPPASPSAADRQGPMGLTPLFSSNGANPSKPDYGFKPINPWDGVRSAINPRMTVMEDVEVSLRARGGGVAITFHKKF
jgi:hypothetical protein